tara:strand:+ start:29460 stop:29633 length:174 start_codon:yes stop_codon:yes gene_type:complete
MSELSTVNEISSLTALLWVLYPIAGLITIEYILRFFSSDDDDDGSDGGKAIPIMAPT